MSSDYSSLLAFDSLASEQSVRVAVYDRALTLRKIWTRGPSAESIADSFILFVQGQRWRLEALDAAIKHTHRRSNVEKLLERASEIIAWVVPVQDVPVLDERPAKKKVTKPKR